jgi:GNAT superfamily N-acetyltransferase
VQVRPVTPDRWEDLVRLFGPNGACAGCWCMWFRQTQREHWSRGNHGNRRAMKLIVAQGRIPGILAYVDCRPAGWCSIAPRQEFGRILRSPTLKPIDRTAVWSVVCFYVAPEDRGTGMTATLLEAALDHAVARGATVVEAYPHDAAVTPVSDDDAYVGTVSMFRRAGFEEVARRAGNRPIMRRVLGSRGGHETGSGVRGRAGPGRAVGGPARRRPHRPG